ncbi:MAG: tRNA (N6-isopentenyl adenosine(37)-C2)-methylthiotransferase MiaB [Bacteroidales bacterium]|nr:tRNA (N6-isopentenyl adenosine(37)-C2)-methylthiotransferase MiaB [Bacteroidales bacterium]
MKPKLYIETYGCQMNFADSDVLAAILAPRYERTEAYKEADLILINTCSIRDHAEQRVLNRLREFVAMKRRRAGLHIGIVGCMAERMKDELLEEALRVDLVVGPDAYRQIPDLLDRLAAEGEKGLAVDLSKDETYHDIIPLRAAENKVSAFVSIMRGCQNFCAYCVVPYTRGAERSRPMDSIVDEVGRLFDEGYREVTLLGQNVNSYRFGDIGFPRLMAEVAAVNPQLRVRFATSHPKDLSDELLDVMASHANICHAIHLPVQAGSDSMLKRMNRKYTREHYLQRVAAIRRYLPDTSLSTDIIAGFCGETEAEHQETLSLMREVCYDSAFMFKYSDRPGTFAHRHYVDDIPEAEKTRRLNEIIALQTDLSLVCNQKYVGRTVEVLVEGVSEKRGRQYIGRNSQNKVVLFEPTETVVKPGDYVQVRVTRCTAVTLLGALV